VATEDRGHVCSACQAYIPADQPFKKAGDQTFCLTCTTRPGFQPPRSLANRLGRFIGALTPFQRLIGVVAVACLAVLVGTWAWTSYEEAQDEDESSRSGVIRVWASAATSLDKVLRLRGDLSRPAVKRARRDQLLLMSTGMAPDEAVEMLEVFSERRPKATPIDWLRAAYAWQGKRPNTTKGTSYTDCAYFTRRFMVKSTDDQVAAAEAGYDLIIDSQVNSFWVEKAMLMWLREAENGLVAWPSDTTKDWSLSPMEIGVPPLCPGLFDLPLTTIKDTP
jgi:hypothetical protein